MREEKEVLRVFQKELDSFEENGDGVKELTVAVLQQLPDYFWEQTGKGENTIIVHTKASLAFANTLFKLEFIQKRFPESARDMIRSALLLHDGFAYGNGEDRKIKKDHPYMMALYLMNEYWDRYLPNFIREVIADMIGSHSGQWNQADGMVLKKPEKDAEIFVHMCVYLASKGDTTVNLPGVVSYYRKEKDPIKAKDPCTTQPVQAFDFNAAMEIAGQMVKGRMWDGNVYYEGTDSYVYLDRQKVSVADKLRPAFVTIGQSRSNPY